MHKGPKTIRTPRTQAEKHAIAAKFADVEQTYDAAQGVPRGTPGGGQPTVEPDAVVAVPESRPPAPFTVGPAAGAAPSAFTLGGK